MKALIVKTGCFSDIVQALPVLDYLHGVAPGIEIDWVVEEPLRELLDGNPLLSAVHPLRSAAWRQKPFARQTWRELARLKKNLVERHYAMVFDIQGDLKSGLVCWLSGVADRIGFAQEWLQDSANLLFTTRQTPMRRTDQHVTDQCLRLVSVPFGRDFRGISVGAEISTPEADESAAAALLATLDNGLVFLFHCGAAVPSRLWYNDGWIMLGKALLEQYPASSLLLSWGSEAERAAALTIAAAVGGRARIVERFSLKGLAALLKKVDLVVGGDVGPVHLAAAVGTPTVSLYRSSDARRTRPRGDQHAIARTPLHCSACQRRDCDKDDACRRSITAEKVLATVATLFSSMESQA